MIKASWGVNVNLCYSYFGRDYKRGDIVFFIKCAEWLENRFPNCEVWYGHDIDDENISRFGIVERKELLEYYLEHQKKCCGRILQP